MVILFIIKMYACNIFTLHNLILPQSNQYFHNQLENVIFQRLWWMQDGAPVHKLLAVRQRRKFW